nr:hypothetical protein [Streptomyces sabulosicollis]
MRTVVTSGHGHADAVPRVSGRCPGADPAVPCGAPTPPYGSWPG